MRQKALNMSIAFLVGKLLVAATSILQLNVIKKGILISKYISMVRNTSSLSLKHFLGF